MVMLGMEIPATPIAPPRISLVSSAEVTESDDRWTGGITIWPENCAPGTDQYWWNTCDSFDGDLPGEGEESFQGNKTADNGDGTGGTNVEYQPYVIWTSTSCSAAQAGGIELAERALRKIEGWQSHLIERELEQGNVAQAGAFPNNYLMNSPTDVSPGNRDPVSGLGELEQALAENQPGQVGMIHAQRRLVTHWLANELVFPETNGRRLRTAFGTIVVPGSGYAGDSGVDDSTTAYATGLVRVFLGPIKRLITDAASVDSRYLNAAELDRSNNEALVIFERVAAAVWDDCAHFSADINPMLGPVPGSS